jgi:hypothetical protein
VEGFLGVLLNFFPLRECLLLIAGLRTWEIQEDIGYLRFFSVQGTMFGKCIGVWDGKA